MKKLAKRAASKHSTTTHVHGEEAAEGEEHVSSIPTRRLRVDRRRDRRRRNTTDLGRDIVKRASVLCRAEQRPHDESSKPTSGEDRPSTRSNPVWDRAPAGFGSELQLVLSELSHITQNDSPLSVPRKLERCRRLLQKLLDRRSGHLVLDAVRIPFEHEVSIRLRVEEKEPRRGLL